MEHEEGSAFPSDEDDARANTREGGEICEFDNLGTNQFFFAIFLH